MIKNCVDYYRLWFILTSFIQNALPSLLSRMKNRYEYLPEHTSIYPFTDDLYDFEYTNILQKSLKPETDSDRNKYHLNSTDDISENLLNLTSKNDLTNGSDEVKQWSVASSDDFLYRPTVFYFLTTTTVKSRKTWSTYFPRKTLPILLGNASTVTRTQENTEYVSYPIQTVAQHIEQENKSSTLNIVRTTSKNKSIIKPSLSTLNIKYNTTESNLRSTDMNIPILNKIIKRPFLKSWCYNCGLNETKIPSPHCHNILSGRDQGNSIERRYLRVKCIKSLQEKTIKNTFYGPWYRGGCFKRFLDVGIEYDERGCRTYKPFKGKSFASKRFVNLETLLNKVENGCVSSPHASLTPFSRAISLYAYYHVCVCTQKYCNNSNSIHKNWLYSYLILLLHISIQKY